MNGANDFDFGEYKADVTSYGTYLVHQTQIHFIQLLHYQGYGWLFTDYDSPLSESGDITEKYRLLRKVLKEYSTPLEGTFIFFMRQRFRWFNARWNPANPT